ncbi:gas vesicle structural protein GvpA [Planosporangium flavigriseum]|uniref:gas vesicle protein GvpJ n=1 Tax=Planosporangium flavigriseum TaxID=373681 RepID=UPI001439F7F2|nr:gas vesicle structural protein GvpA [Planosporangium flavigriseum]
MSSYSGVTRAPRPSGLADVLELILDKGIVIDAYVLVSLVGIELLTIDARIVIASVDTYLRFAEAVNRLDLQPEGQVTGLPGLVQGISRGVNEGAAKHRTKGVLSGVKETLSDAADAFLNGEDDDRRRAPSGRRAPSRRTGREED